MKFDFDTYEFAGLIAPGSVVVFGLYLLRPEWFRGADGAVVIAGVALVAYVLGHLLAAIGNSADGLFQAFGASRLEGVPLDEWITSDYCTKADIPTIRQVLSIDPQDHELPGIKKHTVTRMRDIVLRDGHELCTRRLETFNGLFNLSRGLAVALFIDAILAIVVRKWEVVLFCAIGAVLACFRVRKFREIFNLELVQQFLLTQQAGSDQAK